MARGEGGRSVRVFTVASESRYVVVRNVPTLGVIDDLLKRLSLYGKVCEYRLLDHPDDRHAALQHVPGEMHAEPSDDDAEHQFTDVMWVQYETVNNARHAKVRGVQKPFFGSRLQISYAPQFESRADTAAKLAQRRQLLQRRSRPASNPTATRTIATSTAAANKRSALPGSQETVQETFIGPQLPSRTLQQPRGSAASAQPLHPTTTALSGPTSNRNAKRRRI